MGNDDKPNDVDTTLDTVGEDHESHGSGRSRMSNGGHDGDDDVDDDVRAWPPPQTGSAPGPVNPPAMGTILEAAFVDPAYSWPPKDGEGRNAIELQASTALLTSVETREAAADSPYDFEMGSDGDLLSINSFESENTADIKPPKMSRTKVVTTTETTYTHRCGFLKCCRKADEHVINTENVEEPLSEEEAARRFREYEDAKLAARRRKEEGKLKKKERARLRMERKMAKRRAERDREKYSRVPEGILVYRLDTAAGTVTLLSGLSSNTDESTLMKHMVIAAASPSNDKSRKGICLTGMEGETVTLVACEQRTATAWLEAMDMMMGKVGGQVGAGTGSAAQSSSKAWAGESLDNAQRAGIEAAYLNLALYSNNLIRAGALPNDAVDENGRPLLGQKNRKDRGGAGGVYYSVSVQREEGDEYDDETLESIAKRRAVIKDSWDFYRMICSLLRDRRKYDEAFKRMRLDPVFPYLNSMTGLNNPGDDGGGKSSGDAAHDKMVYQRKLPEYASMTRTQVTEDLIVRAEAALPSLVEICKALAGSLGMEEVGVGPVKEVSSAIRKAEKRYMGDVLQVTDYCRALLVVKDLPTLLALLELARDSFGPLIRRVKLSSLKSDRVPKPGGYRDCIINMELKDHICEVQVHIWPMWVVCGVDGFRHYRHCLEYSTDTFRDPYDALSGLDRKTM